MDFPLADFVAILPWAALGIVSLLAVTWLVGRAQQRHVVMDVSWGLGFVVVAVISFLASAGQGDDIRRVLLLALTALWGLRLAGYLAWRLRDGHEDPRYTAMLARESGSRDTYAIARVYLPQGIVLFLVSMVQQVGMLETGPVTIITWIGVGVWIIGMIFEVGGDAQLAAFKADPAKRGTILTTGLWAWTRHPNYFGDCAVWWGLFLITASSWPGILTILSPLLMTWALMLRTGKPLTESRMMDRPGYREYMESTSGFFPRPPRTKVKS